MAGNYRSVFDIIWPVMIGPSSSHTAGAVAIGQEAYKLFNGTPKKVTVHYYGSFAQTHRGHGTDYAIAAGILGYKTDDLRVPKAPEIAKKQGIDIRFVEEEGPSPISHPNTAVLDMTDGKKRIGLSGCSIGGGAIEVRDIKLHGIEIKPTGPLPIVLLIDKDKRKSNEEALAKFLMEYAPFSVKHSYPAIDCNVDIYEIKNYIQDSLIGKLKDKFKTIVIL